MQQRIFEYLKASILPVTLAFLFALQNLAFNYLLKIYSPMYSARLIFVTFALGIVLYCPALLFKKRGRFIYLFIVSIIISIVFCSQYLYFKYSESFLQFSAIRYFWQIGEVKGTVKTLVEPNLIIFAINILVLLLGLIIEKKAQINFKTSIFGKIIIVLLIATVVFFGYRYLINQEKKEWGNSSRLYTDVYDLNALVGKMGIINFSLEDAAKYILRSNLVSAQDKKFLENWAKNRQKNNSSQNKYFGSAKGKNIIIIQVESLENAAINTEINGQEITPNLNKLAKEGLYFNNYYSPVGPGNTADAEFMTMDSIYPLADDVVFIDYAKNQYAALPKLLEKNGYETYSMHGDVPTFWNRSNIYPNLGYGTVYSLNDYTVTRPVGHGPSDLGDEDLFNQSLPRLEKFKKPFLATLITMSSHTPFILPDDLQTLNIPEDSTLTDTQKNYLESVHYTDKAIGEFIDGLKKDGLYDNSIILIWGDHGSSTNISEGLGLPSLSPKINNTQVPMILLGTGLSGTDSIPATHIDIYPTITNLLGIQTPKTVLGQDLLNTKTPVATHFELISGGIDYILSNNLAYLASEDGTFLQGKCYKMPDETALPIEKCQTLYNQQSDTLRASNIIVHGDLLKTLLTK